MARVGRKRKQGARTKTGRLSRAGAERFDRGSDWVQSMRDKFGEYYNSALGRAFAVGLLGEGNEAKDRLDKARKFVALYGAVIGKDRYRCALDTSPRGGVLAHIANERDVDDQEWLIVNAKRIDDSGCRPFFDQLTSSLFTDTGPPWLDRLIWEDRTEPRDNMLMDAALKGIDAIGLVAKRRLTEIAKYETLHEMEHGALRLKGFG